MDYDNMDMDDVGPRVTVREVHCVLCIVDLSIVLIISV